MFRMRRWSCPLLSRRRWRLSRPGRLSAVGWPAWLTGDADPVVVHAERRVRRFVELVSPWYRFNSSLKGSRGHQASCPAEQRRARGGGLAARASSSTLTRTPCSTTGRPPTSSSSSGGGGAEHQGGDRVGDVDVRRACPAATRRGRRACPPPANRSRSSRPSTRAPPMVAISSASRTVSACGPPRARANSSACRDLLQQGAGLVRGGAVDARARPATPASRRSRARAMPAPSRALEVGQCATDVPVAASRAIAASARCTAWASQTSGPSQPSDSTYSTGRAAEPLAGRTPPRPASRRGGCASARPCRGPASAACSSRSPVTENGEHGATPIRSIESERRVVVACRSPTRWRPGSRRCPRPRCPAAARPALAEVHRPAGRVEPQPDPRARPRSRPPSTSPPSRGKT